MMNDTDHLTADQIQVLEAMHEPMTDADIEDMSHTVNTQDACAVALVA